MAGGRAGIVFERKKGDPQKASEREQALELNQLAVAFFKDRLAKSQEAQDYLAKRGHPEIHAGAVGIGLCAAGLGSADLHLQQQRADLELAAKIGLIKARRAGRVAITTRFATA